ncbi:MAG TPA: hypothetical protein DD625_03165 [Leuconostoc mesenteroides]|nr:hypothetical protein [Leuconostoc mesenteroides]
MGCTMARTTVSRLRFQNINSVIAILNKQAPLKASKIAEISGLSVVSVNKILNDLSAVNMISINSDTERTGGRFAKSFALDYDAHQILVIQIAEQHKIMTATATITNLKGDAVTKPIDKTVVTLSDLTNLILKVLSDSEAKLRGIVIGIPGAISNDIITNADMTSLIGINLKESVEKLTGIDTFVMNDVNAMIYGAEPKLVNNADYLAQVTNIALYYPELSKPGAAIMINGKILNGANGLAGEIMHSSPYTLSDHLTHEEQIIQDVQNVLALFDPDHIVLYHTRATLTEKIIEKCQALRDNHQRTRMIVGDDPTADFREGLIRYGREQVYQLIMNRM